MKYKNQVIWGVILTATLMHLAVHGEDKKQTPAGTVPAHLQKPMSNPPDSPDLPNVLIIGDSISIGYTLAVRKSLKGKADVFRPITNCAHSGLGVQKVKQWLGDKKWDVIHFNFGIWDTHCMYNNKIVSNRSKYKKEDLRRRYTTEQYVDNLSEIVAILQKTGAKLIWASTTPYVSYGEDTKLLVIENNKEAKKLMDKERITVNDLHTLALPNLKKWQSGDGCHFKKQGYDQLAKQVTSNISDALSKKAKDSKPADDD